MVKEVNWDQPSGWDPKQQQQQQKEHKMKSFILKCNFT